MIPTEERKHLELDLDLGAGYFRVSTDRWDTLKLSADGLLMARGERVHDWALASLVETAISTRLA